MPYLRLTADRRGYENTFLMHVPGPGAPARVLYWYRTAPGVRIGRPALDDAAMRWLEEQYPDIDFDWHDILDEGAVTPVEVEPPLPPRKRRPRAADAETGGDDATADTADDQEARRPRRDDARRHPAPAAADASSGGDLLPPPPESSAGPDLLAELVGRGIAGSLRQRFRAASDAVQVSPAPSDQREAWQRALAPLDPDGWTTPEAILAGVAQFEAATDAIRRAVDAVSSAPPADPPA